MQVFAGVPPSGVVTFLFTDIEGSTRRWESDAASMRAALACRDKVLRAAIESHGGFLFSHSGDGVAAAFASPKAAVDAAVDAQQELKLPVRIGIATGEAELRDGDYFGTVLNRAARVMDAGHGGQILLAELTAGLLSGVELLSLGPRRLRDVPDPITLFQAYVPGLRAEFPALRTQDAGRGNLRAQTTSLVGRDSELAEIETAIRTHRLVTLTGMGGVGKTRLALEVASRMSSEFPDDVWVFELAAVSDPAAVPDAVAAVLGVTQQPGSSMTDSVAVAQEGRTRHGSSTTVNTYSTPQATSSKPCWLSPRFSEDEKSLLVRCSVFAGGFDLESACAVAGSDDIDDYAVLDGLDALVCKSLLVVDRTVGRTRYSMLETIRQFAAEQLAPSAIAAEVRTAHA